jgi:3-dehydroquinate synthase
LNDETGQSAPGDPANASAAAHAAGDQPDGIERLRVDLGVRGYEIHVGSGVLARAGALMAPVLRRKRVFVITDRTVAELHLPTLERALDDAGIAHRSLVLPVGEKTKSWAEFARLADALLEHRIERRDAIVALGGGVIGDLAGFAAAAVLRGVDYVQVPTTLLAQVDSSVGGKTGINSPHGKNLVGAFHQPRLVLADTGVLDTLPKRELLAGYAEVAKYGLIDRPEFFHWLEANGADVVDGAAGARRTAVLTSCAAKAGIVARDETEESGARALLNLGHTFAHALEAECGYEGQLLHGEAVAIGLCLAAELSAERGYMDGDAAARVHHHLAAVGLPTGLDHLPGRGWDVRRLLDHMSRDKKVQDGRVPFVLMKGIGGAFLDPEVPPQAVEALLTQALAA